MQRNTPFGPQRNNRSSTEDVALVAANRYDLLAVDLDLEAAHRLAQVAGAVVDGLLSAHAASLQRSGFLRITDRVDEIAARFDTLIATGELDAPFFGADAPSVAARGA